MSERKLPFEIEVALPDDPAAISDLARLIDEKAIQLSEKYILAHLPEMERMEAPLSELAEQLKRYALHRGSLTRSLAATEMVYNAARSLRQAIETLRKDS